MCILCSLRITYTEVFHCAVQIVCILTCFYATSTSCGEECIKLPTVTVDLSGLFVFLNSLTFSFTYFKHLFLATHNCKMILYTYPSIIKKLLCIPYNYEKFLFVCTNASCCHSVFHVGVATSASL